MTKEEIFHCLLNEICLYDPKNNIMYQPDITDNYLYHGIQIFHIAIERKALAKAIKEYTNNDFMDEYALYFWTRNNIPAPGSCGKSKYGYSKCFGFTYDDIDHPQREEISENIEYFASKLVGDGTAETLLTETDAYYYLMQ